MAAGGRNRFDRLPRVVDHGEQLAGQGVQVDLLA
jgi:hypothetical protein